MKSRLLIVQLCFGKTGANFYETDTTFYFLSGTHGRDKHMIHFDSMNLKSAEYRNTKGSNGKSIYRTSKDKVPSRGQKRNKLISRRTKHVTYVESEDNSSSESSASREDKNIERNIINKFGEDEEEEQEEQEQEQEQEDEEQEQEEEELIGEESDRDNDVKAIVNIKDPKPVEDLHLKFDNHSRSSSRKRKMSSTIPHNKPQNNVGINNVIKRARSKEKDNVSDRDDVVNARMVTGGQRRNNTSSRNEAMRYPNRNFEGSLCNEVQDAHGHTPGDNSPVGFNNRADYMSLKGVYDELKKYDAGILKCNIMEMEKRLTARLDEKVDLLQRMMVSLDKKHMDIKDEILYLSSLCAISLGSKKRKRDIVDEKDDKIQKRLTLLEHIFDENVFRTVIGRCVLGECHRRFQCSIPDNYSSAAKELLLTVFFAKQPDEGKSTFSSAIGQEYSRFRRGIMLTALRGAQLDKMQKFVADSDNSTVYSSQENVQTYENKMGIDSMKSSRSTAEVKLNSSQTRKLKQPMWLRSGYITEEDCDVAIKKKEVKACDQKKDEDEAELKKPGSNCIILRRKEVAEAAAVRLYEVITSMMHKARDSAKQSFFYEIGYLFVGWKQFSVPVDQKEMKLYWASSDEQKRNPNFSDLPTTLQLTFDERNFNFEDEEVCAKRAENLKKMADVMIQRTEMILIAEHHVMVKSFKHVERLVRQKKKKEKVPVFEKRRIRKAINVMDATCRLIAAFADMGATGSPAQLLSTEKNSLRSIFILSVFVREMIDIIINDVQENGISWLDTVVQKKVTENGSKIIEESTMNHYQPTPSKQKDILGSMILTITAQEYDTLNRIDGEVHLRQDNDKQVLITEQSIDVNEGDGIYDF